FEAWHRKQTCQPIVVIDLLWMKTFPWILLACAAFPIAIFCARFPLKGSKRVVAARLSLHFLAALVHLCVFEMVINGFAVLFGRVDRFWDSTVWSISSFGNGLLTFYFTVLGVTHAVLYYRES